MHLDKKAKRIIAGSVIAVAAILLVSLIYIILDYKRTAKLDILVAPLSAEILVDGEKYENGVYEFEPGEVRVMISKEGFIAKEMNVELKANETVKLYTYLMPVDGSLDWYLNHEEDQMILNSIGDAKANEDSKIYKMDNPIVEVLPIIYANYDENWNYTEFRVDGGEFDECDEDFCLKITDTTGGNYDFALSLVREKGFEPSDYEIIYEYKPIVPLE